VVDVSVIILSFNEAIHIARCIDSVKPFAKEIFVIDCFSTDGTDRIARERGAQVIQRPWPNNHAIQFNWAVDNLPIHSDWIMRIDADEFVLPELASEIQRTLGTLPPDVTGVNLKRRVYFMNRWIRRGGYYPTILLRMFRRGMGRSEQRLMDEHLRVTQGRTVQFEHDIVDHNLNDLTWWTDKHNKYATREAIAMLIEAQPGRDADHFAASTKQAERKRWLKHHVYLKVPMPIRALIYFLYRYVVLLGFADGKPGLIWHTLQGFWYRFLVDVKRLQFEDEIRSGRITLEQIAKRYGIELSVPHAARDVPDDRASGES
jgi:glycosyltransferase involved in cell wall biosynthesis